MEIRNSANGAEVLLYGEIGLDATAADFAAHLHEVEADAITLRVNSPGGDVYEGLTIMNALKNHPARVTAYVEGLAASAASFIVVGGADEVVMCPHSELMIHDAMSMAVGNASDMQAAITDLERVSNNLADIYAFKAGGLSDTWREVMRAETWFTADEAVAAGLADRKGNIEHSSGVVNKRFALVNKFKGRQGNPPEVLFKNEGESMSFLNEMARFLGLETAEPTEEAVREELRRQFANEAVTVTAEIDVTYPESVEVTPTGKVDIAPEGEIPTGLEFEVTNSPEGWQAEVDAATGVVSVTAPAASNPGDEESVVVTVANGEPPVEFEVAVKVVAGEGEEDSSEESKPEEHTNSTSDVVTIDRKTFEELQAAAKTGWETAQANHAKALEAEVDKWIDEGRISAGMRSTAVKAILKDAETARNSFGANPKGTIPRKPVGHGVDDAEDKTAAKAASTLTAFANTSGLFAAPKF